MITLHARQRTIAALHQLRSAGGYPDVPGGPIDLGTTLSAIKALGLLGARTQDPDAVQDFVVGRVDPATGAWTAAVASTPSVLATAAGLLCLKNLDATQSLRRWLTQSLGWMAEHAQTREEHFMTIAVVDECEVGQAPARCVEFFRALEQPDGTFGPSVLLNGIAASALLRAGQSLANPSAVSALLLAGQTESGGFADAAQGADLWTTYCVMRALTLMGTAPDGNRLAEWVLRASPEGPLSVNATYQSLCVLDWIATPVLDAARRGDVSAVRRHLLAGGDPDIRDLTGWTPLAAAAVRGQAPVVRLLLSPDHPGGKAADPDIRVPDADGLPVFWAGQSGDLDTVRAILEQRPEHLFATSSVNGHTVLLQAVFFGTDRHRNLVAWLLGSVGDILGIASEDRAGLDRARHRLLAACNVRGYTATTMAKLWNNGPLVALLSPVDDTTQQERDDYRTALLASIALPEPTDPEQKAAQRRTDALLQTISQGFEALNAAAAGSAAGAGGAGDVAAVEAALLSAVTAVIEAPGFDINRLGGPLAQTPVIGAVTGSDADSRVGAARLHLTSLLLKHGADPDLPELHPMGVDAVIRSAVLNHFECLQEIARYMGGLAFAGALNERPAINGQTALDDTVHRALTASDVTLPSHLDQIRWAIEHGGRVDIPDFTGVTVADRARLAVHDPVLSHNAPAVLSALGLSADPAAGPGGGA